MLLPQTKDREYRFKLALRMGLPIFALVTALLINTLISDDINITPEFYTNAILVFGFSIYFMLYIIYTGFDTRITEIVSKTFTREYLYAYLKKELKTKEEYTLLLFSIDNLHDINTTYGIKNGDKVLLNVAEFLGEYLTSKGIRLFAIGHIKGGDFVIGLDGRKVEHSTLVDMMCLKMSEFSVDDIEVKISGAITDTSYSNELEYMIENLFEIQELNKSQRLLYKTDEINPSELESLVINAIKNRKFILLSQNIYEGQKLIAKECFVKLKREDSKLIHQKSFMKVISKLGLNVEYDLMILEQNLLRCNPNEESIHAINTSPSSLRNPIFIEKAKELLRENSTKNRIMFILSENEYYSYIEKYNAILKSFKSLGALIAIDRLGSIHTSFLYLRELDIDVVRFDSFYAKHLQKSEYESIIDGFNLMAHSLGVKTWMKLIESQELYEKAQNMKIDYTQGKYLAELEKTYES